MKKEISSVQNCKKAFARREKEQQDAEDYQKLVRNYYTGTATYQEKALKWFEQISNNTAGRIGRGASGEITTSINDVGDIVQNFASFFSGKFWREFADSIEYAAKKLPDISNPNKII